MRNLTFYIFDDRYSAPNINFSVSSDADDGRNKALDLLAASEHHSAVEVWWGDELLVRVERPTAEPELVVRRKLALHTGLDRQSEIALQQLLGRPHNVSAGELIARAGDPADQVTFIRDGVALRSTHLRDGRRQVHSVLLAGDAADLEASLLVNRSDNIEALTACSVWVVPKSRLALSSTAHPKLAEAFLREATLGAEITREWVVNIGQRSALERVAHFLCETCTRMDAMGARPGVAYPFPLTQRDIADAQGLSVVHVNRVMKELRARSLVTTQGRQLWIHDREALERVGSFEGGYLHFVKAKVAA